MRLEIIQLFVGTKTARILDSRNAAKTRWLFRPEGFSEGRGYRMAALVLAFILGCSVGTVVVALVVAGKREYYTVEKR